MTPAASRPPPPPVVIGSSGLRILLPPSEAKRAGGDGCCLDQSGFGSGPLARHRARIVTAVRRTATGRRSTAQRAFGLPAGPTDAALAANADLLTAPTRPALERYTGVLYRALDIDGLDNAQRIAADQSILIFSGLWGVLGATEPVPDYRVPAAATLPRLGRVGTSWRPVLTRHLPGLLGDGPVLDLRSTDYLTMWRPDPAGPGPDVLTRVVTVRIRSRTAAGGLAVISFASKDAKGRLVRELVTRIAAGAALGTAEDVADGWVGAGLGDAEVATGPGRTTLELVTADR